MRSLLTLAVLLAAASTQADNPIPRRVMARLSRDQPGAVEEYALGELKTQPDEPNLLGLLASAQSVMGHHVEALDLFEQSVGSPFYEEVGLRYHADSLRAVGDGRAAAALRSSRLDAFDQQVDREHYDLLFRIDDLRVAGDLDAALDAADEALARDPSRPSFYAAIAQVHMDQGDLDAAGFALYIARMLAVRESQPVVRAEGRLLLEEGDPAAALQLLNPHRRMNLTQADYWSLVGECSRRLGDTDRIAQIHRMKRFKGRVEPALVVVHARALRDEGQLEEARTMVLDTLADLPGNRDLLAVAQEIGAL